MSHSPGEMVEVITGNEWWPAQITRGPFKPEPDEPEVWEVEIYPPTGEPYISARYEREIR